MRVPGDLLTPWNADLVAMLGAPGLVTSLGWLILLLFACPQASSVTVSVIVLGLTGWLVTCFFGCSGARDILWLCYLRVPGVLNADLVACPGG